MKKKHNPRDFNLNDWAQRLEAGRTDDPELVLAQKLSIQKDEPVEPSLSFRDGLRARLLEDYQPRERKLTFRRVLPFALAALLLLVVLLAWPRGVQGVSAAEILRQARIGAILPEEGKVIYDRLQLGWNMGNDGIENVLGEIWFSPENRNYRYQLTSSTGEVLFYQAYDGEYTTQSVHLRPVGKQSIKQIYRFKGFVPLWLERPGDGGLLANPSPVYYWLLAVRQAMDRKSDCTDLYCLLGLPQEGWSCAGSRCKYSFGDVDGLGSMGLELEVRGPTRLEDGRQVYEIRLLPGGALLQYLSGFGTVYVDAQSYQIVKVTYAMKGILKSIGWGMTLDLLERRWMEAGDLPADFFRTPPEGVQVIPWEGSLKDFINSQYGYTENRAWIISSDPPSGTRISGKVTFNLEVGYQLKGLPYANLKAILWGVGKDTAGGGTSVPIQGGEGVVQMSFTVDTDELAEGAWAMGTDLGIYVDAGPGFAINDLSLFDTQWCVRCDPAELPSQPLVLGTYWRPQVEVVTTGQAAQGYVVKSITASPTHVLLHRAGQVPAQELAQVVETEPIDLSGLAEAQVIMVKLILPEKGEMIGTPEAVVTVEIGPAAP
jgi:hypothetical protein